MSTLQLIENLSKLNNVNAIVLAAQKIDLISISKQEYKDCIEIIANSLKCNRHKKAVAAMMVLLLSEPNKAISDIRRKGIFRSSRYGFDAKGIVTVINSTLYFVNARNINPIRIREDKIQYITYVKALLSITPEVFKLRKRILERLKCREESVSKTLLFIVNKAITSGLIGNHEEDPKRLSHWSPEDIIEAYSYIIKIMREEQIGNKWIHVDTKFGEIFNSTYEDILVSAAKINSFFEAETLIDGLPYMAEENTSCINIKSIDPLFEKSVRLGYIQADMQRTIRIVRCIEQFGNEVTINKLIEQAFSSGMSELVQIIPNPIERLVFIIPNIPSFFSRIVMDKLYYDEFPNIVGIAIDNFMDEDENPLSILVSRTLKVSDVIKLQRLFGIINAAYNEKLNSIDDIDKRTVLAMRSMIPVMKHEHLSSMLTHILSPEQIEDAIQLLTLKENEHHIDLQYKPLIKSGEYYIIPPALLAYSNLCRNIVIANNLRSLQTQEIDPMQKAVVTSLKEAGFNVKESFEFKIDNRLRETDIFCWKDGHFFIFECKNPYHPCNPHELRNSYEHIKTAEEQLDIRANWLKEEKNKIALFNALECNIENITGIHTGIISGNRLLNAFKSGEHPIRQAHEFINVITRGYIEIGKDKQHSFWCNSSFMVDDLINYLEGESIISLQLNQLSAYQEEIDIGTMSLIFHRYQMDLSKIHHNLSEGIKSQN